MPLPREKIGHELRATAGPLGIDDDPPRPLRARVDPADELVADRPRRGGRASSASTPSPISVTGVPAGSSPGSSTANESIEIVPTTVRSSPPTRTRAGEVTPEAVRVADGHDPDPGWPRSDEPPAVTGALPDLEQLDPRDLAPPAEHGLEPVVGRVDAERREAVQRDPAAGRVEPRDGRRRVAALFAMWRVRSGREASPRETLDLLLGELGSESAVARCVIRPTTCAGGGGSSESP